MLTKFTYNCHAKYWFGITASIIGSSVNISWENV